MSPSHGMLASTGSGCVLYYLFQVCGINLYQYSDFDIINDSMTDGWPSAEAGNITDQRANLTTPDMVVYREFRVRTSVGLPHILVWAPQPTPDLIW